MLPAHQQIAVQMSLTRCTLLLLLLEEVHHDRRVTVLTILGGYDTVTCAQFPRDEGCSHDIANSSEPNVDDSLHIGCNEHMHAAERDKHAPSLKTAFK